MLTLSASGPDPHRPCKHHKQPVVFYLYKIHITLNPFPVHVPCPICLIYKTFPFLAPVGRTTWPGALKKDTLAPKYVYQCYDDSVPNA